MLQKLRDKTSGWIATVILGLLIIPFAFFGMESYMSQRVETYAARIAQPPAWWPSAPQGWPASSLWRTSDIDTAAFRQRLENDRLQARSDQGDKFDAKAFESIDNKRQVLDRMIDEQVMRLTAEREGIVVSDAEVRNAIQALPEFQVDGKFDADRYQLLLASQSPPQTPRDFEQRIRDNLQYSLIPSRLAQSAFVTGSEVDRVLRLLGEQRDVSFVTLPPAPADTAAVTDSQIRAWYASHAGQYRQPETVRLEYVEVDGSTLPAPVVDEAALRKRYQEQAARFSTAEQRQVSHILVQVAADASAAVKQAAEARAKRIAARARAPGADFAALAKTESDDAGSRDKGGDLGWMTKGSMPGSFEDAAFGMKSGEVRGPVKSDFGWHIIKVGAIRSGSLRPFEDVRAQLEAELQSTGREQAYNELSGKLVDQVYKNPSSLQPAATALGLPLKTTQAFSRAGGEGIAGNPKILRMAFSDTLIQDATASDPIDLAPSRSVIIRVLEHNPERARPLADVTQEVIKAIRLDRQRKATESAANALVKAARATSLAKAAESAKLAMAEVNGLVRSSTIPSSQAVGAFFDTPRPRANAIPIDKADLDGQYIVYAIRAVRDGDLSQPTAAQRSQLRGQLEGLAGTEAQQAYVKSARAAFQIKVAEDRL